MPTDTDLDGRPATPGEAAGPAPDPVSAARLGTAPGLALAAAAAVCALGAQWLLPTVSPLLVAILLGVAVTNLWSIPGAFQPGLQVAAKRLLRLGIVVLGLQLALGDILALGWGVIGMVLAVVGLGIPGTMLLGRALGLRYHQRLLIACGFSICGAAAVAAVDGAVDADEEDVASAIGLVVLYGTLMIGVAPALLGLLGLTSRQQGLVAGGSIHEVAQVVAAAGVIGGGALQVAVLVKLARVLLLAPVIVVIGLVERRAAAPRSGGTRPPVVPLFVVGFLAAALVRTFAQPGPQALAVGAQVQTALLSAAMFALGCGVRLELLKRVGGRQVLLGALSTVVVFVVATTGALSVG